MYEFDVESIYRNIETQWKDWADDTGFRRFVVGISGGIDSTCVAALGCRIFGKENIIGVSLPCDGQSDMSDVDLVFETLGISRVTIDIGDSFHSIIDSIENNSIDVKYDTKTNLPARLRMSTLYAVAQSLEKCTVLNTCQISETVMGNDTLFGDSCGSYAPIQELTKTEVRKLAEYIGVDQHLVKKIPIDGLQPLTDEERLGVTYDEIDKYIRTGIVDEAKRTLMDSKYKANRFKMKMINISHPIFNFKNFIIDNNV